MLMSLFSLDKLIDIELKDLYHQDLTYLSITALLTIFSTFYSELLKVLFKHTNDVFYLYVFDHIVSPSLDFFHIILKSMRILVIFQSPK